MVMGVLHETWICEDDFVKLIDIIKIIIIMRVH